MEAKDTDYTVSRTDHSVLAGQLEGLSQGMQAMLQLKVPFGKTLKEHAKNAEENFLATTKGRLFENWPSISDATDDTEIFALVSVMLSTCKVFLTPEQLEMHKKPFGFNNQ